MSLATTYRWHELCRLMKNKISSFSMFELVSKHIFLTFLTFLLWEFYGGVWVTCAQCHHRIDRVLLNCENFFAQHNIMNNATLMNKFDRVIFHIQPFHISVGITSNGVSEFIFFRCARGLASPEGWVPTQISKARTKMILANSKNFLCFTVLRMYQNRGEWMRSPESSRR